MTNLLFDHQSLLHHRFLQTDLGKLYLTIPFDSLAATLPSVLIAKQLKAAVEQKVGHRLSQDYLWDMLHRHGLSMPRPKMQKKKEKLLKKAPALFRSTHTETRPLKVFSRNEACFGRINNISRCWVPQGKRATVKKQIIREHTYAFSAVCPLEGESYSLISPVCNTASMNELLEGLSAAYSDEEILLFADRALAPEQGT